MTPYDRARTFLGTWEWKDGHNPVVVRFFADVGHDWVKDDETAWCAAFVGAMLERCQIKSTRALNARSYLDWGKPVSLSEARPGDVVILSRGTSSWQGHVGFFVRMKGRKIVLLGGNQANQVNETAYAASRLLGVRRVPTVFPDPPDLDVHLPDDAYTITNDPMNSKMWEAIKRLLRAIFGGNKK